MASALQAICNLLMGSLTGLALSHTDKREGFGHWNLDLEVGKRSRAFLAAIHASIETSAYLAYLLLLAVELEGHRAPVRHRDH